MLFGRMRPHVPPLPTPTPRVSLPHRLRRRPSARAAGVRGLVARTGVHAARRVRIDLQGCRAHGSGCAFGVLQLFLHGPMESGDTFVLRGLGLFRSCHGVLSFSLLVPSACRRDLMAFPRSGRPSLSVRSHAQSVPCDRHARSTAMIIRPLGRSLHRAPQMVAIRLCVRWFVPGGRGSLPPCHRLSR